MGLKYFPIGTTEFPYDFAEKFKEAGYTTLIETGTYTGANALKASKFFEKVLTIEQQKFTFLKHLNFVLVKKMYSVC